MCLSGKSLIGSSLTSSGTETFQAVNPATGELLSPVFYQASADDVDDAARLAQQAFGTCRIVSEVKRGEFLATIAAELMACGAKLVERSMLETGLPQARLAGELNRTVHQLQLFSERVQQGAYVEARIDRAVPDRSPTPKPDLRQMLVALGPVAVFGASNFPLAFSVAGGDTASALAAGCPVVAKGHPAHPGTSELAGQAIRNAVRKCQMPEGTFSLVQGHEPEVGAALVLHPEIKAVAFTGSLVGGRALFDLAASRPEPIPVYAEMGSVNPVFLLPEALRQQGEPLAVAFAESATLGVGQFCTAPGLVFAINDAGLDAFVLRAAELLRQKAAGVMLHAGIKQNFLQGVARLTAIKGVEPLVEWPGPQPGCLAAPLLWQTDVETLLENPVIGEEVFGPSAVIVACQSKHDMLRAALSLSGQLTATVHGQDQELLEFAELFDVLERTAGRIVVNGFPTGLEVCDALHHGGPYPASTDSRTTSVGTAAVKRFLRPVCFQNVPQAILPGPLQDKNPRKLWRLIDGVLSRDEASGL